MVLADRWLGQVLDAMDELDLWRNTMVILHTDHGTFNGDHGRIGKLQTHEFAAKNMIPFIVSHPELGHGERRSQLVQNVDIYATVLAACGRELPEGRHGMNLLPVLADPTAPTRDYAIAGQFSRSATITDGRWTLHQGPDPSNRCTGTATISSASTAASRSSGATPTGAARWSATRCRRTIWAPGSATSRPTPANAATSPRSTRNRSRSCKPRSAPPSTATARRRSCAGGSASRRLSEPADIDRRGGFRVR